MSSEEVQTIILTTTITTTTTATTKLQPLPLLPP